MKLHVIILAAGNSRRFGGNKLLHNYKGKPVYQHILDAFREADTEGIFRGEKMIVSQYKEIEKAGIAYGYTYLHNSRPQDGISRSIRMGIEKLHSSERYETGDAVMFCVCDQPELQAKTIVRFAKEFGKSGKGIGCLKHGGSYGNPVIFLDKYWEDLKQLSGEQGGKAVRNRYPEDVMSYEVEQGTELRDIDYREDIKSLVIVRGGGDLATGVIHRLYREGYRILILETGMPACIRRQVSFCEAVYDGEAEVEGVTAVKVKSREDMEKGWNTGKIPVAVDPEGTWIEELKPDILVDAILAKKNLGTHMHMAPLTIGLGPGFEAKKDVDVVIETMRGESLGKIYTEGRAIPNTGIPGVIAGFSKERVIHAPASGEFQPVKFIGDKVEKGQVLGWIEGAESTPVYATIPGFLRGMIREGYPVKQGLKMMDIEPRTEDRDICFHISDKAVCIADSVYKVIKAYENHLAGR